MIYCPDVKIFIEPLFCILSQLDIDFQFAYFKSKLLN